MEMGATLEGERRVALRFERFPEVARANFRKVIEDLQPQLQSAIRSKIPVGKTGAIRAALAGGIESNQYRVRGWVSLAGGDRQKVILPAIALEYGSNRAINVKEKADRLLYTVYGKYIFPMHVNVDAYSRTTNIPAQRFLRSSLEAMSSTAVAALTKALDDAVNEA